MRLLDLTVRGNPVPQGRPRFFVRNRKGGGKCIGAFDPGKSKSWKETVKTQVIEQGATMMRGALKLSLEFHFARPNGHFGTGKNTGIIRASAPQYHTVKPDADNCAKAIKDALKGICYHDDSQIVSLDVVKLYHAEPHVRIVLQELEG